MYYRRNHLNRRPAGWLLLPGLLLGFLLAACQHTPAVKPGPTIDPLTFGMSSKAVLMPEPAAPGQPAGQLRYICLSDLHLGQDESLLTDINPADLSVNPHDPSPVLQQLVKCLEHLAAFNGNQQQKPVLILAGDVIELALEDLPVSGLVFEQFIRLIMESPQAPLFEKIVYIPGNHDHHVWERTRETQYFHYVASLPPARDLPPAWHSTALFSLQPFQQGGNDLVDSLVKRVYQGPYTLETYYPDYGLLSPDGTTAVLFHHGQYTQSVYSAISEVMELFFPELSFPVTADELEQQNFAWIDFVWSSLGREGAAGSKLNLLYDKILIPDEMDELGKTFTKDLIAKLEQEKGIKVPCLVSLGLEWAVGKTLETISRAEGGVTGQVMTAENIRGMFTYLETILLNQLLTSGLTALPEDVTFVFGHTHRAFEELQPVTGYAAPVSIYNTGGWVFDPPATYEPVVGGAIVLFDENLNSCSLRMYQEKAPDMPYSVEVHAVIKNGFYQAINGYVNPAAEPYATFSSEARQAVELRYRLLQEKEQEQ